MWRRKKRTVQTVPTAEWRVGLLAAGSALLGGLIGVMGTLAATELQTRETGRQQLATFREERASAQRARQEAAYANFTAASQRFLTAAQLFRGAASARRGLVAIGESVTLEKYVTPLADAQTELMTSAAMLQLVAPVDTAQAAGQVVRDSYSVFVKVGDSAISESDPAVLDGAFAGFGQDVSRFLALGRRDLGVPGAAPSLSG